MFRTTFVVDPARRSALQELTRELDDWRLAEYVERLTHQPESSCVCKVSNAGERPMIFLPGREQYPALPSGPTPLVINGTAYEGDFVKVALNVVRLPGDDRNRLPEILRGWFGADAGRPGTRHGAVLDQDEQGTWRLQPAGQLESGIQLWRRYSREQIPSLFGFPFSTGVWNQGFVTRPGHVFLLVTLDKSGKSSDFQYRDHFISPTVFQWESQYQAQQASGDGRLIRSHKAQGVSVHLFIRKSGKLAGRGAAQFVYCGDVSFVDWESEKPITVRWQLPEPVPERLGTELGASTPRA